MATRAYEDTALPISHGQTISQPYTVARMTEALLRGGKPKRVLEIGTGSGYQTAILAMLTEQVFTVERIQALQLKARTRLRELRLNNVKYKHDDGNLGWKEKGPFDGIIVTAAPVEVPEELLMQLDIGGRLIIPAGSAGRQVLRVFDREEDCIHESRLDDVQFVPLLDGIK